MRIIKKRYLFLLILGIITGFYFSYKLFLEPKQAAPTWVLPEVQETTKKFITEETLINQIQQKQQLITMEVEMSEMVTLDDSWGTIDIFKKTQGVKFYGIGTFIVDLSSLHKENISVDNNSYKVSLKIPQPTVKSVELKEDKTMYQTPENGLMRFGEITLSLEESQMLLKGVKEKMFNKMNNENFISDAKKSSEETLKGLIKAITLNNTDSKYDVEIQFQ